MLVRWLLSRVRIACGLLALALLLGCGSADREARARQVAEAYFQAVKEKDLERAASVYATRFFVTRSLTGWKRDLGLIDERLGALHSYTFRSSRWRTDFIPPDSGSYVTLVYDVAYARHRAVETLTVYKPFARGEFRIVDHQIDSEGFLKE
jgi:hypothetical protein